MCPWFLLQLSIALHFVKAPYKWGIAALKPNCVSNTNNLFTGRVYVCVRVCVWFFYFLIPKPYSYVSEIVPGSY